MTPKISFWLLLRLAVLLATFLLQSGEGATYNDFANRHIDHPQTRAPNRNAYCNLMMQRRGMTNRSCKPTNTFIHRRPSSIRRVCHGRGKKVRGTQDRYVSKRRFRVIVCRHTSGSPPNCNYNGQRQKKKIIVSCVNRLPVHFAGLR